MSGKRVVLILLGVLALWCGWLAYYVWSGTRTPHYRAVPRDEVDARP